MVATRDKQTSLRMTSDLLDRLQQAAEQNRRPLGAEISMRLEASFETSVAPPDPVTAELLGEVASAAGSLAAFWTPWHSGKRPFSVFKEAVGLMLDRHQPADDAEQPISQEGEVMFGDENAATRLATVSKYWRFEPRLTQKEKAR